MNPTHITGWPGYIGQYGTHRDLSVSTSPVWDQKHEPLCPAIPLCMYISKGLKS